MEAEALTGKAVGEEEQHCTCVVQQMQLLFLCPLKPSFSCAKGPAHWLCLPCGLASCELKTIWSPGTFWRFTVLILQPWCYCYAPWDVESHGPKAAGQGELWWFQIVFCHLCNEECGCSLVFMEKSVDQLQMTVGSILWEMRGNCQNYIVEKLWKYFHAERFYLLPSRFGIARHTSKQEVHWGPQYLICVTRFYSWERNKALQVIPSTLSYCHICIIVLSLFPSPCIFCHLK